MKRALSLFAVLVAVVACGPQPQVTSPEDEAPADVTEEATTGGVEMPAPTPQAEATPTVEGQAETPADPVEVPPATPQEAALQSVMQSGQEVMSLIDINADTSLLNSSSESWSQQIHAYLDSTERVGGASDQASEIRVQLRQNLELIDRGDLERPEMETALQEINRLMGELNVSDQ